MSMLDSFFNKGGFKASKCKTLLKLTIPRIKLLRNKRELQNKQMRLDIAKLLESAQEPAARVRVEHITREVNLMAAQEIIELFCELIVARLPIIEAQRECPLDLKEAISSVCFAAPRCADLPELQQLQMAFASKYGKEFIVAATGLLPDCGVNRQLIELFSVRAPSAEKKLNLLKKIAEEHGLDWDPTPSQTELSKSHEDLLDGSAYFFTGTKLPLPTEKHIQILHSTTTEGATEQFDSESGLDSLEQAPLPSAPHTEMDRDQNTDYENALDVGDHKMAKSQSSAGREIADPSVQSQPTKSEINMELEDVLAAAQDAAESAECAATAARAVAKLAQLRISEFSYGQSPEAFSDNPFGMESPANSDDGVTVAHVTPGRHNSSSSLPTYDDANESVFGTVSFGEGVHEQVIPQQLIQGMDSMEGDPLSPYPNLFGSGNESFTETSHAKSFGEA